MLTKAWLLRIYCNYESVHIADSLEVNNHVCDMSSVSALRVAHAWGVNDNAGLSFGLFSPSCHYSRHFLGLGIGVIGYLKVLAFRQSIACMRFTMPCKADQTDTSKH